MNIYNRVIEYDQDNKVVSCHYIKPGKEIIKVEKVLSTQQRYRINKSKDIEELSSFIETNEGKYIHNVYRYNFPYMAELQALDSGNKNNIHIVRMIVLASYLTFGGKLFDKNNHKIKKSSLKNIWDVKNRESINQTYKKLLEVGYIYEKEGYIMINENLFVKGVVDNWKQVKKVNDTMTYTRLFANNIQDMYYNTPDKQRKQLANLFKVLPYINFKYNVFCNNPTEVDEAKLELFGWKDLALLCGYNETNKVSRFKKDLWNLDISGHDVIGEFKTKSGMAICINPKIYYSGDNADEVRHLYSMFRMCGK